MKHHGRRLARACTATVTTAALLVGLPVGLATVVGWPLPATVPTLDRIRLVLRSGVDPQLVINALAVVIWIVWAQLVWALAVEVVAVARGANPPRLPLMPGLQPAVNRLVAAIAMVAATAAPLKAMPPLPPAVAVVQPLELAHHVTETAPPVNDNPGLPSYVTRRFDTLWGIAERTLGDGRRWQEVRALNPYHAGSDGRIQADVTIKLPADAHVVGAESTRPASRQVTVEPGDSFWSIARHALTEAWGDPPSNREVADYSHRLIETNRHHLVVPDQPDLIQPGQSFTLPPISDPNSTGSETSLDRETVTVADGDSFWSIAATALTESWGRAPTDQEVAAFAEVLIDTNRHRLAPPQDPDLIYPGQTFLVPPVPPDTASPVSETQESPDEVQLETAPLEPDRVPLPSEPSDRPTIPSAPEQPVDIAPSDDQASPSDPTVTTSLGEAIADQSEVTAQGDSRLTGGPEDGIIDNIDDDPADAGWLPTGSSVAGLGILAAGLVALIERLRRIQFQHRRPGTTPTPPPQSAAPVETRLRTAAAPTGVDFIDVALRAIGSHVLNSHTPAPQVVGVHLSPSELRVLLWTPNPHPPDGWRTDDDDTIWVLSTNTDVTHLRFAADGTAAPYPTLVTAGHDTDNQLLLDLEFIGALEVAGSPADVADTCYTIATELAASPLAEVIEVVCVGFGHDLAQLERIRVVDKLDAKFLDGLDDKVAALESHPAESALEGRVAPWGDSWYPVVVIDPVQTPPDGADRLLAAATTGSAIAAVVGYRTGDRWRLDVEGDAVHVEPLRRTLNRRNLTSTEQTQITNLVAAGKDLEGVPTDAATLRVISNGHHPDSAITDDPGPDDDEPTTGRVAAVESHTEDNGGHHHVDRADTVEGGQAALFITAEQTDHTPPFVRVLGTVTVDGITTSRKNIELVVYMALHRDGVDSDRLMEVFWPDEPPDAKRLNNLTSRVRLVLGERPGGGEYLSKATAGIYRPSPHLQSDIQQFEEHIAQADRSVGDEQVAHLQAALRLVTGVPFSGTENGYTWASAEALQSHAIVAVDDAAHRLTELALTRNEADVAIWAARRGLSATPACETCYRNLMRVAVHQDNQAALEATFNEMVAFLEADEGADSLAYLDPETVQLYEEHSRRYINRRKRA